MTGSTFDRSKLRPSRRQVDLLSQLAQRLGYPSAKHYCAFLCPPDKYGVINNWNLAGLGLAIKEALATIKRRQEIEARRPRKVATDNRNGPLGPRAGTDRKGVSRQYHR